MDDITVQDVSAKIDSMTKAALAHGWVLDESIMDGASLWPKKRKGLLVVFSISKERDDKWWVHISCSYDSHLPSWDDMVYVRDELLGKGTWALQVIPSQEDYVNVHRYCLHMWHCLNGPVTPDFRKGYSSL